MGNPHSKLLKGTEWTIKQLHILINTITNMAKKIISVSGNGSEYLGSVGTHIF